MKKQLIGYKVNGRFYTLEDFKGITISAGDIIREIYKTSFDSEERGMDGSTHIVNDFGGPVEKLRSEEIEKWRKGE